MERGELLGRRLRNGHQELVQRAVASRILPRSLRGCPLGGAVVRSGQGQAPHPRHPQDRGGGAALSPQPAATVAGIDGQMQRLSPLPATPVIRGFYPVFSGLITQ
jgi:hypothetical protein